MGLISYLRGVPTRAQATVGDLKDKSVLDAVVGFWSRGGIARREAIKTVGQESVARRF